MLTRKGLWTWRSGGIPAGLLLIGSVAMAPAAHGQAPRTVVNGHGFVEQTVRMSPDGADQFFALGEHSLFLTSAFSGRGSFLGEFAIRPNGSSPSGFVDSVERALVRWRLDDANTFVLGKVHTPVNYWNDAYHHGRIFFPTIDRPLSFSALVPIHTLGVQLRGQNIGSGRFGYDVMAGNGIAASETSAVGVTPAVMAGVHFKPRMGMYVGASIYYDHMEQNGHGSGSGHGAAAMPGDMYRGELEFTLASMSLAFFGEDVEFLAELSGNATVTDSLGTAHNGSAFVYGGARVAPRTVGYALVDWLHLGDEDLHLGAGHAERQALGLRFDLGPAAVLKGQVERSKALHDHAGGHSEPSYGVRIQLAYTF